MVSTGGNVTTMLASTIQVRRGLLKNLLRSFCGLVQVSHYLANIADLARYLRESGDNVSNAT